MSGHVWWENRDEVVHRWVGADVLEWLQGQLTQSVLGLGEGESRGWALVKPTGQLLGTGRIAVQDGVVLTWTGQPEALEERVEQMVILEDVAIERLDWGVFSVIGGGDAGFAVDRTGEMGSDVLGDRANVREELAAGDELNAYAVADRMLAGARPRAGVDWDGTTLPPELGAWFDGEHVHYDKGCYTGQEVLMRIHSRGHTNRTWGVFAGGGAVSAGQGVGAESRENAGTVTQQRGELVGAFVRNDVAGERLWAGDVELRARG